MHGVWLLALAVQDQVAVTPAYVGDNDGRMYLWVALGVGVLALIAALLLARAILPLVKDNAWFWDSEMLLVAQKNGYRLNEVPVHWEDDLDTRVHIVSTATEDLKGIWRLRRGGVPKVAGRG